MSPAHVSGSVCAITRVLSRWLIRPHAAIRHCRWCAFLVTGTPKHRRNTMSTLKRWQTPASLSLVLAAAIMLVLAMGYRAGTQPALASTTSTPVQCPSPQPAAAVAAAPVVPVVPVTPAVPANDNVAGPRASGSGDDILGVLGNHNQTVGNDGGFGDIGMQFQNVNINAPITNVHISGTGNSVSVGSDNSLNITVPVVTPDTPSASSTPTTPTPSSTPTPTPTPTSSTDPSTPSGSSSSSGSTTPSTPSTPTTPTGSATTSSTTSSGATTTTATS